ncbi:MAG: CpaF family protein [Gaiellaceae bacterium]
MTLADRLNPREPERIDSDRTDLAGRLTAVGASSLDSAHARRSELSAPGAPQAPGVADPYSELKTRVQRACIAKLGPHLFVNGVTPGLHDRVIQTVSEELRADGTPLTADEGNQLILEIANDVLGYGPIEPFLHDDTITEVMVNGPNEIYIERDGLLEATSASFVDDAHVMRIIDKIVTGVGRRIDEASPMVDARLPDGSRVNAIIPPLSMSGPVLTVRKFSRDPYGIDDLIGFGTLTPESSEFLDACVQGKLNVLISGGTGTGKTTLLNAVSSFIPNQERILTIEDAAELQLQQEHVVSLEARPASLEGKGEIRIRDLVRNALRMRPDRIIVGEVRGAETLDMLQAMNTGHEGSLTTIHANSPRDALSRLETLVLTAGVELPHRAIREQIASAFDMIVHLSRLADGSRRVTHITEIPRMESDVITLQDVFVAATKESFEASPDGFSSHLAPLAATGLQPHLQSKLAARGIRLPNEFFDVAWREPAKAVWSS